MAKQTLIFVWQASGGAGVLNLVFMGLIFVFFYFFFIRPQAKKQKEQVNFIKAVEKGDEVVTSSGIIGKVNKIEDNIVTLELDTKTYIRVMNSSISKEMTDLYKSAQKSS
jgi:preprotein translocase subunit YajC